MREGLRKVPEQAAADWIVFFRDKSNIVANAEQTLKHSHGVVMSAHKLIAVGHPEAAWKKSPLTRR
jgi:hypothetical protein